MHTVIHRPVVLTESKIFQLPHAMLQMRTAKKYSFSSHLKLSILTK